MKIMFGQQYIMVHLDQTGQNLTYISIVTEHD